jgi:MFS family permease
MVYFIPIYFQAVKGVSALQSGIDTIPLIVPQVLALIMAGIMTSKLGYYMPFIYTAVVLSSVAAGLLTTLTPGTGVANWVGYQILFGFGIGCGFQLPQIAAQTVLPFKDIPTGIAITLFFQSLGGSIFVSAGNNVLNGRLVHYITALRLQGVNAVDVIEAGATAWRGVVPAVFVDVVVDAYSRALRDTFRVGLITVCLSCIGAAFMEWKNVKRGPTKNAATADGERRDGKK